MYLIAAIGILTICLSILMISSPKQWSKGIVVFSQKRYFHYFEISSRAITGLLFIAFHLTTKHPNLIFFAGSLLIIVSIGLIILGEKRHRQFAVWSAQRFLKTFRIAGFFSLGFGFFLIYTSTVIS